MSVKDFVYPIPLTSIDSSTFSGAYQVLTSGTPQACFYITIVNNSGADVTVSVDGTNDHLFVPKNTSRPYNFQTNSQPMNQVALLAKGFKFWVKGLASTGSVYLEGWYSPISGAL